MSSTVHLHPKMIDKPIRRIRRSSRVYRPFFLATGQARESSCPRLHCTTSQLCTVQGAASSNICSRTPQRFAEEDLCGDHRVQHPEYGRLLTKLLWIFAFDGASIGGDCFEGRKSRSNRSENALGDYLSLISALSLRRPPSSFMK